MTLSMVIAPLYHEPDGMVWPLSWYENLIQPREWRLLTLGCHLDPIISVGP